MITRYQGFTIISSLILIAIVMVLCALGTWQMMRMNEKQQQLAQINAAGNLAVKPWEQAIHSKSLAVGASVSVSGKVNQQQIWLLDNQFFDKALGYRVLTDVDTNAGPVLVDFGWVKGSIDRAEFPEFELPASLIQADAVVTRPGENVFVNNDYAEHREVSGQRISRIQALQLDDTAYVLMLTEASDTFARRWVPVVMPPEKHLAYAIQWFGLAAAAGIIGFFALRKR